MFFQQFVISVCAIITLHVSAQNVYEGNYRMCHYEVSKKKFLDFQNYTRTIVQEGYEVHFNLCDSLSGIDGCDGDAMVCVKKFGSGFIPNAGRTFTLVNKNPLRALNGTTCKDGINYTTIFNFNTFQKEREKFFLADCTVIISLNPEPSCSTNVDGFMLDITPLSLENNIYVNSSAGHYSVAICNYSSICGAPYSGCFQNGTHAFIDYSTQKLEYDYKENKLMVKGKAGKKRNVRLFSLTCNWFVTVGKTEKLVKQYDFGIESKYGCVKLPMNCILVQMDTYSYDLSKLNRPNGWHLQLPDGKGTLSLNVCGTLRQPPHNECSEIHSQICLKTKEKYVGLGSIAKPLEAKGDRIELEFFYGSRCPEDDFQLLRSKIKFVCARTEMGPKFISSSMCAYNFLWETPEACSKLIEVDFTKENSEQEVLDCKIGEFYDLNPLVSNTSNYEVRDDDGHVYHINLCRPLVITNETYGCKNKGACFSNATDMNLETKYIGFGGTNMPEFVDDGLVVSYKGGLCGKVSEYYELVVKFRCPMESENSITFFRKTDCRFDFFWDTPLVCKRALLKCHEVFNFDKITASQMIVKTGTLQYNFNLCDSQYAVTTLSSGKEIMHNANTSLKYSKCQYTLEYKLTDNNRCDDPQVLNTVYLSFECTKKATDYYEKQSVRDCVLHMKFWTSQACNVLKNTGDEECLKKVENDKIFEYSEGTENVGKSEKVQRSDKVHRNCTINLTGGDFMNISSIAPVRVISKNKNVYTIANKTSACGDFICKNGESVGSIVDVCPGLNIDLLKREIRMDFIGSTCDKDFFKVALLYRCKESQDDVPAVVSEYACNSTIEVPDVSICKLLQRDLLSQHEGESHGGLIAGIIVMIIIIMAVIAVLIWQYVRRKNYMAVDKSRIYLRNCSV